MIVIVLDPRPRLVLDRTGGTPRRGDSEKGAISESPKSACWLRCRSKIEDEDEFEDEDDKRRTSERSQGASGSIRTSARDGECEHCA